MLRQFQRRVSVPYGAEVATPVVGSNCGLHRNFVRVTCGRAQMRWVADSATECPVSSGLSQSIARDDLEKYQVMCALVSGHTCAPYDPVFSREYVSFIMVDHTARGMMRSWTVSLGELTIVSITCTFVFISFNSRLKLKLQHHAFEFPSTPKLSTRLKYLGY